MKVERAIVFGWSWLGIGVIRFYVTDESSYYTMWMLFLTRKFAVGFHAGGGSKIKKEGGEG